MKAMRRENWSQNWAFPPSFRRKVTGQNLGNMTKSYTKKRNEVERLFRRIKGFRRIFTRFDKLDVMFMDFVVFALIVIAIKQC
jgi:transposase